jgi:hypothetical protein
MQQETEYPKRRGLFSKRREEDEPEIEILEVIQTGVHNYTITTSTKYDTFTAVNQTITCEYQATAQWIYEHSKQIQKACNFGDVIEDIPFKRQ